MPNLSNSSISMAGAINRSILPLEEKIKNLELKILEYDTKLNLLKKKIEKISDLEEKVKSIISYTDKARLSGAIKDIVNIKKQVNLSKKSKLLTAINQLKQRITQCENAYITSDEDEESKKNN
jgi:hypothetical protein